MFGSLLLNKENEIFHALRTKMFLLVENRKKVLLIIAHLHFSNFQCNDDGGCMVGDLLNTSRT